VALAYCRVIFENRSGSVSHVASRRIAFVYEFVEMEYNRHFDCSFIFAVRIDNLIPAREVVEYAGIANFCYKRNFVDNFRHRTFLFLILTLFQIARKFGDYG